MDWLTKIASMLPIKIRTVVIAAIIGLAFGAAATEVLGVRGQVSSNTVEVKRLNDGLRGVNERLDDVISVLCFMALGEGGSPLTCLPGGTK